MDKIVEAARLAQLKLGFADPPIACEPPLVSSVWPQGYIDMIVVDPHEHRIRLRLVDKGLRIGAFHTTRDASARPAHAVTMAIVDATTSDEIAERIVNFYTGTLPD
jgi:hypothetical protein